MLKKIARHLKWRTNFLLKISLPQFYFSQKLPCKILSGPFKGMKYLRKSTGSVILPKIIGTYEDELNVVWGQVKEKKYDKFIDIGAAEGYYAIGLGKFIFQDNIPVVAFELTKNGQDQIKQLASLNNFTNIKIQGICKKENLAPVLNKQSCFILMDIEGGEFELLDNNIIDYSNCDILVEVHPSYKNDLENNLVERFRITHEISIIKPKIKQLPATCIYPDWVYEKQGYLMNEFRGDQSWLWMESKNRLVV